MILTWGVGGRSSWWWSPSISGLSLEDFGDSEKGSLTSRTFLSLGETNLWSGETSLGVLWDFATWRVLSDLFSFTLSRISPLLAVLLPRPTSCLMLALLRARDLRLQKFEKFIHIWQSVAGHFYSHKNKIRKIDRLWKFPKYFLFYPNIYFGIKIIVRKTLQLFSYLFSIPAIVAFSMLEICPVTTLSDWEDLTCLI